jgi:hypothetical protein
LIPINKKPPTNMNNIFSTSPDSSKAPTAVPGKEPEEMREPGYYASMTQSLDISYRVLKSFWEMHEWSHQRIQEEFKKLCEESKRVGKEREAVAAMAAASEVKDKEAQVKLELAESEHKSATETLQEAKSKEEHNSNIIARVEALLKREEELNALAKATKESQNATIAEREEAQRAQKCADVSQNQAQTLRDQIVELQRGFWPACLNNADLEEWRIKLQDKAKTDGGAALLIAAVHRFCAAEECPEPQELLEALQYLGRRLYAEVNSPELSEKIGDDLNQCARGRFLLRFPRLGEAPEPRWMTYQAGLTSVQQVTNWAVFKVPSSGAPVVFAKAEVASEPKKT